MKPRRGYSVVLGRSYREALGKARPVAPRDRELPAVERDQRYRFDRPIKLSTWRPQVRTAISYTRLMRDQGRVGEAHGLLAPFYGWFTEGFGTKDLKDAKTLLEDETTVELAPAAQA